MALNLLKQDPAKRSINNKHKRLAWDEPFLETLLAADRFIVRLIWGDHSTIDGLDLNHLARRVGHARNPPKYKEDNGFHTVQEVANNAPFGIQTL